MQEDSTEQSNHTPKQNSRAAFIIRALKHRNYRLFFSGQSISLIGTWLTRIATSWMVYRLTGSALLLGTVSFAGQIPTFFFAPMAGVWVDRWDRHRLLVLTQILSMIQSFMLAVPALRGTITIPYIIVLSIFQGLINAFDTPARQAFVSEMVERREDMSNAIALNSSMVNAARLLGPSIGGVLIAAFGEGWCFTIDGFSYIAVIISLLLMKITPRERKPREKNMFHEMAEGFRYTAGFKPISSTLLLLALVSLMGMPYTVLMPIISTEVLHGGAHTLGFLMAATGVGALTGAVFLAARKSVRGLGNIITRCAITFGVGLIAFSFSREIWLSMLLMPIVGFGFMVEMAASNTFIQTIVDEDKRGRVMSFYTMAFMGTAPFGSLLGGTLADKIGAPHTIQIGGVACILGGIMFAVKLPAIRKEVRPIYERLGIIQEVMQQ